MLLECGLSGAVPVRSTGYVSALSLEVYICVAVLPRNVNYAKFETNVTVTQEKQASCMYIVYWERDKKRYTPPKHGLAHTAFRRRWFARHSYWSLKSLPRCIWCGSPATTHCWIGRTTNNTKTYYISLSCPVWIR